MPKRIALAIVTLLCLVTSAYSFAEGTLFKVPTRDGVTTTLFWEPVENAKATVFLFPGGGGGFGKVENGRATGNNFLVRSALYCPKRTGSPIPPWRTFGWFSTL